MLRRLFVPRSFAALILLAAASATARGQAPPAEPWAAPGLEVTRGLRVWLDAGRINEARKAKGLPALNDGDRVDAWPDASGQRRDLVQPREEARPRLLQNGLRFDGESTFLERDGLGPDLKEFTIAVVAAPLSNGGGFRAFAALHRRGQNDFVTGTNLDMGFGFTRRFDLLNVEGAGFGGVNNLLADPADFGVVRRLILTSAPGPGGVRLTVDGKANRARDRADSTIAADRLVVGARVHGQPAITQSVLDGDILHVLVYDRALDADEIRSVDAFLAGRVGGSGSPAARPPRPRVGNPLVMVADPPPVQVFAPGFATRKLPVELTNVNNVRYRHDGKIVALGYDGRIHLLSDRDGDGLEDTAETFWDRPGSLVAPIGIALTPPGYRLGDGVFVACKGKVALIADRDRDGKADEEIVVAQGWTMIVNNVDALGVAIDAEENVYFGIGATSYTDAYLLDRQGKAGYTTADTHGNIQKVSPDFSKREIIATGIRFPVALAISRDGDLFATDQEGATWLPNGNPFDELLHIQPVRHYGFPPRHPTHLPDVINEPSVFDYSPQHQSTCGLIFDEPVNKGPIFGPADWRGDAILTGYSRGKLYRTKLAKTPAGYVAQNHPLAALTMLPIDACVSPAGDLVVAVHSGQPDWGSGPKGPGTLYKIAADRDVPRPAFAYPGGPQEVRVAFDHPVDAEKYRDILKRITIESGIAVSPGDRFESLRPGYDVVGRQLAAPRHDLPILSAGFSADRRTLILATAPHAEAVPHALTVPGAGRRDDANVLRQVDEIDLGYDLTGVAATWIPADGSPPWSGWLPHPDPAVSRAFTAGSAEHDRLFTAMVGAGRYEFTCKLDLWQMLRPAVQPGSTLSYRLPDEEVTVTLLANGPMTTAAGDATLASEPAADGKHRLRVVVSPKERAPVPIAVSLIAKEKPSLEISWTTREDAATPRPLALRRVLLPWAPTERQPILAERKVPELEGGDWARGLALFHGDVARCSTCHSVRGQGGAIGPDLSNLIHRDYASVFRDIHTPSAAINPDYTAHTIALRDGRVLQGTMRTEDNALIIGDTQGKSTRVDRSEVEEVAASTASIMPEGLDTALGPDRLRDLLTFLLTDPLGPAPIEAENPPPPRRRAEVTAALAGSEPVDSPRPLRVVLAAGPKDHGPGEHDYPLWLKRWSALFATAPNVAVESADGWPSAAQLESADVVVMYSNNPAWSPAKGPELDAYLARGGGLAMVHWAVEGREHVDALASRIGLASRGGQTAFRHGPLAIDLSGSSHPIARNLGTLRLVDESYWRMIGDPKSVDVLGTGVEEGQSWPLLWTRLVGKGRVFVSIPGHYTWSFDDPLFRLLLLRGIAWSAGESVDRFNGLATLGARIED